MRRSLEIAAGDGITLVMTWGADDLSITEVNEDGDSPGSATAITFKHDEARMLHQFIFGNLMKGED
jgi:hypothetical protein